MLFRGCCRGSPHGDTLQQHAEGLNQQHDPIVCLFACLLAGMCVVFRSATVTDCAFWALDFGCETA